VSTFVATASVGTIDSRIAFNEGSGNDQAMAALIFGGDIDVETSNIAVYILQVGAGTGDFQMAVLEPLSTSQAQVVGITNTVTTITGGLFVLPLTTTVTLLANTDYYLAVYNQVNASDIGGVLAGIATVEDAPPINFRVQNVAGFTIGQIVNTSDVSLTLTPWLAVLN
ncbi:MAG: hypothetical protein ACERKO_07960, partial [Acetanaerobacterium sp.]